MTELKILRAFCKNKKTFGEYNIYFKNLFDNMERELKIIFSLIEQYYEKYDTQTSITREELLTFYSFVYPVSKSKIVFTELIAVIFDTGVQNNLIVDLLKQLKERYFATRIVNKLLPVVEGAKFGVFPTLDLDVKEFLSAQNMNTDESIQPFTMSVKDLITTVIERDGLLWHSNELVNIIGSIPRKSSGLVFGYVNSGKSSFCISSCTNFAKQLTNECIVYAGNEESAANTSLRMVESMTGMTEEQIENDPDKAEQLCKEGGMERIKLFDSIVTIGQVKQLLDKYRPRVMVIDQATKVRTNSKEKNIIAMQQLFNEYRELGKMYDTSLIGVTQGDATTANKKYLELSDIYSSKVAIQGELDYAIGIGTTDLASKKAFRYINVPKNKGPMGRYISIFNEQTCQWKDI